MNRVIIIMAKVPRAGNVKTRLQPFLATEQCETLAEAFLADAIAKTENLCDRRIIAFTPAHEKGFFDRFDLENITLIQQTGANLGDRMCNAFEFSFQTISDANVVMIGTDSPTFPAQFVEDAFAALETNAETILGKAADGGFYLIGLRKNYPDLFANIEWSSPRVYEQITRNIERLKIISQTIPDWYDVDNAADLWKLKTEISTERQTKLTAPQTTEWLTTNWKIFDGKT
jgi:rSAM/selenodomain-associated transferase 1